MPIYEYIYRPFSAYLYIYTHIYIITLNKFSCGQLLNNWIKRLYTSANKKEGHISFAGLTTTLQTFPFCS